MDALILRSPTGFLICVHPVHRWIPPTSDSVEPALRMDSQPPADIKLARFSLKA